MVRDSFERLLCRDSESLVQMDKNGRRGGKRLLGMIERTVTVERALSGTFARRVPAERLFHLRAGPSTVKMDGTILLDELGSLPAGLI